MTYLPQLKKTGSETMVSGFSASGRFQFLDASFMGQPKAVKSPKVVNGRDVLFTRNGSQYSLLVPAASDVVAGSTPLPKGIVLKLDDFNFGEQMKGRFVSLEVDQSVFSLEVFAPICDDIISTIVDQANPYEHAIATLLKWSNFLRIAENAVSRNRVVGLMGELLVLEVLLGSAGPGIALDGWTGPDSRRHDFEARHAAIEVKSSSVLSKKTATIHGLGQLATAEGTDLHLALFRFEWAAKAFCVADIRDRIVSKLDDTPWLVKFIEKLEQGGFDAGFFDSTRDLQAKLVDVTMYEVKADFPKLTPAQISTLGFEPSAFGGVQYSLNLSAQHEVPAPRGWQSHLEEIWA